LSGTITTLQGCIVRDDMKVSRGLDIIILVIFVCAAVYFMDYSGNQYFGSRRSPGMCYGAQLQNRKFYRKGLQLT